jgi:hypothetical protein
MSTQFLLKLNVKIQYKHNNIKYLLIKKNIYSMQKESLKKFLQLFQAVSQCMKVSALPFHLEPSLNIRHTSLLDGGLHNRGVVDQFLTKTKTSFLQYFQTIVRSIQPAIQQIQGSLSFRIKRPVPEADFSSPFSSVKVKNDWRSTSSLLFAFMTCRGTNLLYQFVRCQIPF